MTTEENSPGHDDDPDLEGCAKNHCHSRKRDGSGKACHQWAGRGTDHAGVGACARHGGATRNHRVAAQREQARRDVERFGGSIEIDPATALLQEVHRSAATVEYLRQRVNELEQNELVWGVVEETLTETKRKATPNVWVTLYQQERRHLAQVSKAALDAGCAQSIVDVFKQVGATYVQLVDRVVDQVVDGLGLDEEQRGRAPELVRAAFSAELDRIGGGEAA